jgi:hypothetical protein
MQPRLIKDFLSFRFVLTQNVFSRPFLITGYVTLVRKYSHNIPNVKSCKIYGEYIWGIKSAFLFSLQLPFEIVSLR